MTTSPAKKKSAKATPAPAPEAVTTLGQATPPFRNRVIDKKALRNLVAWAYKHHGTAATASMA